MGKQVAETIRVTHIPNPKPERETLTPPNIPFFPLPSQYFSLSLTYRHLLYLEGEKEGGGLGKGRQFYWHFHFHCNLIPITSARSGANFCFSLTPASEERVGRGRREKRKIEEGWSRKGVEAVSGSHVGEMSMVLPQPVSEREGRTGKENEW